MYNHMNMDLKLKHLEEAEKLHFEAKEKKRFQENFGGMLSGVSKKK